MRPIQLPEWLYCAPTARSSSISPAAALDPCQLGSNNPWVASTTPASEEPLKKTLIISKETFLEKTPAEAQAFLAYFSEKKFSIRLWHPDLSFFEPRGQILQDEILDGLKDFMTFNEKTGYEFLSKHNGLSRDQVVWINTARTRELFACLQGSRVCVSLHDTNNNAISLFANEFQWVFAEKTAPS